MPYSPMKKYPGQILLRQFLKISDSAGALEFVNQYGPPVMVFDEDGGPRYSGTDTSTMITNASLLKQVLLHQQRGEAKEFNRLLASLPGLAVVADLVPSGLGVGARLTLGVTSLFAAIRMQVAQALIGDAALHECPECGVWFEVGPGKARNRKAEFCSEEHKRRFLNRQAYLRRKGE